MKHLKLFFALFAMLALGVTNAWGYEVELSTFSATSAEMDNYISYTTAKGGGTSDPAINSNQIRLYQGNPGGNITISAKEGATITEVTIGSAMKTTIKWEIDGTVDTDGTSLAANATATKSGISTTSITCHCYGADSNSRLYVNYLKVVYTVEGGAVTIVKTLKSIDVEGMTTDYETGDIFKFDGTCTATYSVTKNDVAQEDEQKVVTPTSVSTPDMSTAGEKEVTVTYTENEETVTATYTINVTENVITAGTYDIVPNNAFWGTSFTGTNANATETLYGKQDDISILHTRSGNNLYVNDSQTRVYANHYMQISVPAGYVITAIAFTADGTNWAGTHTADFGTMTDSKNWTGSANAVTITFGGTCRITKITVTYAEAGETPEPVMFTVTATAENGTVEGAGEYEEGTEVTLTATAAEGYEFVNWTSGETEVSTENPYTFVVTADVALVANFAAVEPEVIAYELNGGQLPLVGPTNAELWEAFKPYYNTYYGLTRSDQPIDKVSTFANAYMQKIMTDEASKYKWLGDYVLSVATAAGVTLSTDMATANESGWRWAVHAFFNAAAGQYGATGIDFTEAGKPENWVNVYPDATEVELPTIPVAEDYVLPTPTKTGCTFKGWYDNAEGTGEAYTVIPAGWSGTLYAIWKQDPTTALENIAVEGKAVKAIVNGQLIIIKNGVQYNAQGAVVK